MSKVKEIKSAIESLSEKEYIRLRKWFFERDWKKWDNKIESDSKSGRLNFLIEEALYEKERGSLKEI
ncbi:hypothetical protein [Thermodesulfovibrio hydrogeniphilus]